MNAPVGVKIAKEDLLRGLLRLVCSSTGRLYREWHRRIWTVLLWLFAIPLGTFCFLSMLFWAYGVDG